MKSLLLITILIIGCKAQPFTATRPDIYPSPPSSPPPPSNTGLKPIALCHDNTYSYAISPRLACLDNCIDHGGVKQWYPYGGPGK